MRNAPVTMALLALIAGGAKAPPPSGPIDINTATVVQLEQLPGIGRSRAEMIVRIRERNGPFKKAEELRALPRLSEKEFERLRKLIKVSGQAVGEERPRSRK